MATSTLSDRDFLLWVYERMVFTHKEDALSDYMLRLRRMAESADDYEQMTRGIRALGLNAEAVYVLGSSVEITRLLRGRR